MPSERKPCKHEWVNVSKTRLRCSLCSISGSLYRDYSMERDKSGMPIAMYWRGDYVIPDRPKSEFGRTR